MPLRILALASSTATLLQQSKRSVSNAVAFLLCVGVQERQYVNAYYKVFHSAILSEAKEEAGSTQKRANTLTKEQMKESGLALFDLEVGHNALETIPTAMYMPHMPIYSS